MPGRGRPRKAVCPDADSAKSKTRPEETKQDSVPGCPEERQNDTTEEQKPMEQKKNNHTEEKPSVPNRRKEKTEIDKQQKKGGKTKAPERPSEEMTNIQPELTKDTTKHSPKTTNAKPRGHKEKTQPQKDTTTAPEQITKPKTSAAKVKARRQQLAEEKTKVKEETPKDIPTKAAPAKPKLPEKRAVKTKVQPETLEANTKPDVPQDRYEDTASNLFTTLEKLKIKRNDRSDASQAVNEITTHIVTHLRKNSVCFKTAEEPLRTGSYYENLKISNPDEFDVMLPIPVERVNIEQFGDNGAFYSVGLKRDNHPLKKFQENDILSASEMLMEFREEVMKSVKEFKGWIVTRKKKGCPAVTLTTEVQSTIISLDVVLSLKIKSSWPSFTNEGLKIEGWLGTKVKQEYRRDAYYLVPKYEGRGNVEKDDVRAKDVWRISFSHIEKAIMKNHGSEKTCCEKEGTRCCRRECLKLLKNLLSLLKMRHSSFDKFCSYHAKTTFLHACSARTKDSDWSTSNLSHCFQLLLQDFEDHLKQGVLNNFFVPTQNLLSGCSKLNCRKLAQCIMEERDNGFPIFKEHN